MGLLDKIKEAGEKAVKELTSEETKQKAKDVLNATKEKIGDVAEAGKKKFDEINTEENREKAKDFFKGVGEKISDVAEKAKDKVEDVLNKDEQPAETVAEDKKED